MISSEQIKASRALLGWSAAELAKRSNVGATTLRRYEMVGGVPSANLSVLLKLKSTLENAGIISPAILWSIPALPLTSRGRGYLYGRS